MAGQKITGRTNNKSPYIWYMVVFAILLALLSLMVAPDKMNAASAISQLFDPSSGQTMWQAKIPRTLAAVFAGIILGVAGSIFQGILGNRRSSGDHIIWLITVSMAALIAAFFVALLYVKVSPSAWPWFIGDLASASWYKIAFELPILSLALIIALFYYKDLNALLQGEDVATTLGIHTASIIGFLMLSAVIMTAGGLLMLGMASTVLLIVPYYIKAAAGSNYKNYFPVSMVTVTVLSQLSDVFGRIAFPSTLPSGTLLIIAGIPMIAYILWTRRSV